MFSNSCIIGAGTMGSGIALAVAQAGYKTILFDINPQVTEKARLHIETNLTTLVQKGKIDKHQKENILSAIKISNNENDCTAHLVIEAIVEKLEIKQQLFARLAQINHPAAIFASNTSSLSISKIQETIPHPQRVAGLHFFNPAHIMKLVEVVKGKETSDETARQLLDFCHAIKKTPVLCTDSPGFIVNRVARHFYLETLHLVESGKCSLEQADAALENAGFKMGPFKLMDLIGMDINYAVTQSLYEAFQQAPRFKPSNLQHEKVLKNELGKKTGKGFYHYT